jgi:hypothetical protein
MMRSPKLFAVVALLTASSPAVADIRPSPLGDIYASYNDCFKVMTKDGVRPEVLGTLGWSPASPSASGKPRKDGPALFAHPQRAPVIMLSSNPGEGICIVMARLERVAAFEEFKSAWGGQLPKPNRDGVIFFQAEGHPIRLQQTGSRQEPSLTIAVMPPSENK